MTPTLPSAADAANALSGYQAPDSTALLTQSRAKYGIPDLQQKVNDYRGLTGNLTSAIAAVDPSVTGRTAGTFTTEAQRGALVNRERAPIVDQLGTANKGLDLASNDLTTANTNASEEAKAAASDSERKYNQLLQTYNIASAREAAQSQAKAQAEAAAREQANADRDYQLRLQQTKTSGKSASSTTPTLAKSKTGGWTVSDPNLDLAGYARQTGKDLIQLLSQGDAKDKQAAQWYMDKINKYGSKDADKYFQELQRDLPSAFYRGG